MDEARAFNQAFRAGVLSSIADPRPSVGHDEAMAELDGIELKVSEQ
jgi:hypothetical protein